MKGVILGIVSLVPIAQDTILIIKLTAKMLTLKNTQTIFFFF